MAKSPDLFSANGPQKVRREWIQSCEFHAHSNPEVLNQVHEWIEKDRAQNTLAPVLLLDLDSTLYEVGSRTFQILKEWIASPESREFPKVRDRLTQMKLPEMGYSLLDTFSALGLSVMDLGVEDALKAAKKFWGQRFFTNEYLSFDQTYAGAPEFVQKAYEVGAEIVYLTGRDEPGMGKGTRNRLIRDGFPFDKDRTHLLLKKSFELDDLDHKTKATDYVKRTGNLIASFENEPPNVVALSDIFPAAMHVFVDTIYSDRPALPKAGFYRITGFTAETNSYRNP